MRLLAEYVVKTGKTQGQAMLGLEGLKGLRAK